MLTTNNVRCKLEFAWCWVRDGESKLHTHHVNQIVEHGGGANFCVGLNDFPLHGYKCEIDGKMTQALYLSGLQDGVTKTIEWCRFNSSCVIFQRDNDPKHIAKSIKQ